jgi:hypothetical protein
MENLDIIILTTIVSTLFIVFGIVVYREFQNPQVIKGGPRENMILFIGKLFDEDSTKKMNPKQKMMMYKQIKRTISDMETDGVYFPDEVKNELKKKKDEMTCEYSGLRSVMSYLEEDEYHNGHS